jgi:hypothetical protein
LFWRGGGGAQIAVRDHDWKLLRIGKQPFQLYNLASDIGEEHDQVGTSTNASQNLEAVLNDWNKTLIPPAFPGLGARKASKVKKAVEP